jgi:hypothetical protein
VIISGIFSFTASLATLFFEGLFIFPGEISLFFLEKNEKHLEK